MQKHSSLIRAAVDRYNMINEGDRIAVGVSGGKDSLALLCGLAHLKTYYPKNFTLIAITVDPCFGGVEGDYSEVSELCRRLGVTYIIRKTELYKVVFEERSEHNPCSLCAKMRRGILHDTAKANGCNKLALGHHSDDAAETLLMNLFQGGRLESFRPVTYLSVKDMYVIRPMILCDESKIASLTERLNLPVVKSRCPMDKTSERERTGQLLGKLSLRFPDIKSKIIGALERGNISGWGVKGKSES